MSRVCMDFQNPLEKLPNYAESVSHLFLLLKNVVLIPRSFSWLLDQPLANQVNVIWRHPQQKSLSQKCQSGFYFCIYYGQASWSFLQPNALKFWKCSKTLFPHVVLSVWVQFSHAKWIRFTTLSFTVHFCKRSHF